MKLLTKLTLLVTLSKMAVVILFVLLLPSLVNDISYNYTNYYLKEQKNKVLERVNRDGIDYYLQGEEGYGSYTMLKEEYISLAPVDSKSILNKDTIETSRRLVENDTLTYRILSHVLEYNNKKYLLEIGKTTASITQYNHPLQRMALYVLFGLIALTIFIDLIFTHLLLKPLEVIIKSKLTNRKFPFKEHLTPIKTSTTDFKYLDDSLIELMNRIREDFNREREFTSNASHELMTPITILQNKMENMMVDNDLSDGAQEKIIGMMTTLSRLKKIVRSLLLISRIENDQFARDGKIPAKALVEEVKLELSHHMEEKNIWCTTSISENVTLLHLNHDLLFQLIYNLVNNAIRYNIEGGSITIFDRFAGDGAYMLTIKDSGKGIPENDLDHIFDRFRKVRNLDGEGYGLGLAIVKSIAKYHGLMIDVKSQPGKGSEFSIIFPAGMIVRKIT